MHWHHLWALIGTAAAALTATSFIPQIITELRHPNRARVAYGTLGAFIAGSALWAAYGFHLRDWIIIGANLFILSNLILLTLLQLSRDIRNTKAK
jgi:MtN3 and saliva related transmembrane protein